MLGWHGAAPLGNPEIEKMIEPVSSQTPGQAFDLAEMQNEINQKPQMEDVDPAVQEQFETMIESDSIKVAQIDNTQLAVDATANPWVQQPGPAEMIPRPSIADTISENMQDLREQWLGAREAIEAARTDPDFTAEEMMALVGELQHSNIMITMVLQEIQALTQGMSQLMKAS